MKIYHFIILFAIIIISCIVVTDIRTNHLKAVIANKEQIDRNLDVALDDGVLRLAELDDNHNIKVNKDAALRSFLYSLYSSFGILDDRDQIEKLNLYLPVITVTTEEGYYVLYSDEYQNTDGYTYIAKRWSEKFPYYYEDEDFIYSFTLGDVVTLYDKHGLLEAITQQAVIKLDYHDIQTMDQYAGFRNSRPSNILLQEETFTLVRKSTITKCLEKTMAYYTSHHNRIAVQYGITYQFQLPIIREETWAPFLNEVSMFVVFQGYPFGSGIGETYNRVASAGAKISKNKVFYLEQKGWYLVYHKSTCSELEKDSLIFRKEPYYSMEECVKEGAYACPHCSSEYEVFAPSIE